MGTFLGHILPGSMFIIVPFWWAVQVIRRFILCRKSKTTFQSSLWYPCGCSEWLRSKPIEPLVQVLFTSTGVLLELLTGIENGKFKYYGNGQHIAMFAFFLLAGIMELLYHYKCPLPPGIDYASFFLAYYVEGILFIFHLHGRAELNTFVHTCLIYLIIACAVSVIAECSMRHNVLVALCRPYFSIVQGTWFYQVGFILYNPMPNASEWGGDIGEQIAVATGYFVYHLAAVFILLLLVTAVTAYVNRNMNIDYTQRFQEREMDEAV